MNTQKQIEIARMRTATASEYIGRAIDNLVNAHKMIESVRGYRALDISEMVEILHSKRLPELLQEINDLDPTGVRN